ncbi:hypothetical protein L1987_10001 [Smallanthus sonchifolius]|uniref:Uncharacterized protein n=1 Tax=Smallanthus sonchifolius TaxID=185202 RepID=A0ACB9JQW1_9ASTR|nr:hypothetical protein L1987_10001 [Smallanthus sonchifolius]
MECGLVFTNYQETGGKSVSDVNLTNTLELCWWLSSSCPLEMRAHCTSEADRTRPTAHQRLIALGILLRWG